MNEDVLGYLITWTVYGTYLQGDARWWSKRGKGEKAPEPVLHQWHSDRLNYPIALLSNFDRDIVESAIEEHCAHRGWRLWARNARTNHVHAVVTAQNVTGQIVREQLKANCTRSLREFSEFWRDRPVWSKGGHCYWLESEEDLEWAIEYVTFAQDRKTFGSITRTQK